MKEEDLNFSVKTVVQAMRNEYIHGLVVYFRCDFSKTQGNVRFSTGPFDEYTHWKQAIFYLKVGTFMFGVFKYHSRTILQFAQVKR